METPRHWRMRKERYALLGRVCPSCGAKIFPPTRPVCPYCGHGGSGSITESEMGISAESEVEVKKGFGVAVVVIDQDSGDILLSTVFNQEDEKKHEGSEIKNLKPVTQNHSLPAGAVKKNEQAKEAAIREAKEEAGIDVFSANLSTLGVFSTNIFQSRSKKNHVVHFDGEVFIIEVDAKSLKKNQDWEFFPQEEIKKMIEKELLRYPSAAILLEYFSQLVEYLPEQAMATINNLASVGANF